MSVVSNWAKRLAVDNVSFGLPWFPGGYKPNASKREDACINSLAT